MSSNKRESKFKSLRFRLSVWYSGAFTIIFFLVFAIVHIYVYNHLLNLTDNNLFEKAKRHLWLGYPERTTVDVKDVRENFEFISSKEGSHDVFYFFLDSAYNIVAESSLEYWDGLTFDSTNIPYLPDRPGKDELKAFLNDKRNRELKTTVIPLNHEYRSHTILQTIKLDGRTDKIRVAYQFFNTNRLFITGISLQDNAKFTSILSRLFILTYVLLLIVVVVMVNLLTKKALDGVAKVTTTAVQIGKNNLGSRVPSENESTEIRTLAEAFNEMLDRIEQLMKEQRSMTHNIAHDLRSPITSIRGMAETTLTANSSVVDYELMSGRIIANCDRLVHLINSALDISDIESGNFKVETEDLLLSEVLMDCYEVYLPIAEEKKIDFSLAETKEDVKVKAINICCRELLEMWWTTL